MQEEERSLAPGRIVTQHTLITSRILYLIFGGCSTVATTSENSDLASLANISECFRRFDVDGVDPVPVGPVRPQGPGPLLLRRERERDAHQEPHLPEVVTVISYKNLDH